MLPASEESSRCISFTVSNKESCHVLESVLYAVQWFYLIAGYNDPTRHLARNIVECANRISKPRKSSKEHP